MHYHHCWLVQTLTSKWQRMQSHESLLRPINVLKWQFNEKHSACSSKHSCSALLFTQHPRKTLFTTEYIRIIYRCITLNDSSTNLYHVFEFWTHPHTTPPCCDKTRILWAEEGGKLLGIKFLGEGSQCINSWYIFYHYFTDWNLRLIKWKSLMYSIGISYF